MQSRAKADELLGLHDICPVPCGGLNVELGEHVETDGVPRAQGAPMPSVGVTIERIVAETGRRYRSHRL